jgi:SanA protein
MAEAITKISVPPPARDSPYTAIVEKKRRRKRLRWILLSGVILAIGFVWATNRTVLSSADGKIYTGLDAVPEEPVALVLGTAPAFNGNINLFFERRMDAAAALYKAGKVRKVLVSGDNHNAGYDEPTAMRDALIKRGLPAQDIALDYAGFRTLDSIVRAKKVFGLDRCAIVTDDFHLPRALYIAQNEGLDAIGFQTAPLPRTVSPWTYVREVAARSRVWLDLHVLNSQPKFLGPKVSL